MDVLNDIAVSREVMDMGDYVSKEFCALQHQKNSEEHIQMMNKLDSILTALNGNGVDGLKTKVSKLEEWKNRQERWFMTGIKMIGPYVLVCIFMGIFYYINYASITGKH